jgi:hypothetical protein
MAHNNLEEIFANMELYDKNLLQRPTTAKRKVLKFLEVWKKNFKKDLQKI